MKKKRKTAKIVQRGEKRVWRRGPKTATQPLARDQTKLQTRDIQRREKHQDEWGRDKEEDDAQWRFQAETGQISFPMNIPKITTRSGVEPVPSEPI